MTARISVGVPVYNGENYLAGALQALVDQDADGLEIIISDNASTDGTEEICRGFAADSRVRYLRADENRGAAWNYNVVFRASTAPLFSWAAHDDEKGPGFFRLCVEALDDAGPDVVLATPRAVFIDADGVVTGDDPDDMTTLDPLAHRRLSHTLHALNMASPVFGVIRVDALRHTRLIDSFIASDYVLLAELSMLGGFVTIPDQLFRRRLHPTSSREANLTKAQVQAWFDPARGASRLTDRQRLLVEYHRSVRRLPLSSVDRVRCAAVIGPTLAVRRGRVTGGRWKQRVKERVGT